MAIIREYSGNSVQVRRLPLVSLDEIDCMEPHLQDGASERRLAIQVLDAQKQVICQVDLGDVLAWAAGNQPRLLHEALDTQ